MKQYIVELRHRRRFSLSCANLFRCETIRRHYDVWNVVFICCHVQLFKTLDIILHIMTYFHMTMALRTIEKSTENSFASHWLFRQF